MFDDDNWFSKYLIGSLVAMVPILNFAVVGYGIEIMRSMARGDMVPLPSWDDLGQKFVDGLVIIVVSIIYTIPGLLLAIIPAALFALPALSTDQSTQEVLVSAAVLGYCCLCGIAGLYFLAYSFFFPALEVRYARTGEFGECFQVKKILDLATTNISDYILAWLVGLVAGLIAGAVGTIMFILISWIPCIGWILTIIVLGVLTFWSLSVASYAYGMVGLHLGGESAPMEPEGGAE